MKTLPDLRNAFKSTVNFTIVLVLVWLANGCAKQATIPPEAHGIIKHYERLAVSAERGCRRTRFRVHRDDYVLIMAHGKVFMPGTFRHGAPPFACLFMKTGENGESDFAVAQPDNRRFYRSHASGRLRFCIDGPFLKSYVKNPKSLQISGTFTIDIFVFHSPDEERILEALKIVIEANPSDKNFLSQLRLIVGSAELSVPAKPKPAGGKAPKLSNYERDHAPMPKSIASSAISEDMKRSCRTVFQAGHNDLVRAAVFSPGGQHIISGGNDSVLRLWETATGREIRVFKGHTGAVSTVAFNPSGDLALSGSDDKTLRLWEVATGIAIRTFIGHESAVNAVQFSPDGKYALSAGNDKTLRLWEVDSGRQIKILRYHESAVNTVGFSPNGDYAISGARDGALLIGSIATGKKIAAFKTGNACINTAAFSPNGRYVLSGNDAGELQLWDFSSKKLLRTLTGHKLFVSSAAFNQDGRYVLSGSYDHSFRLWEVHSGKELKRFTGHEDSIRSIAYSPNERYALTSSNDRSIRLWELSTGREIRNFKRYQRAVRTVSASPDGRYALWGGDDGALSIWGVETGSELKRLIGHTGTVNTAVFSSTGKIVISGGEDKTVRMWAVPTGNLVAELTGHKAAIRFVAFSPDDRHILSSGDDNSLWLWDRRNAKALMKIDGYADQLGTAAFSPDGRYIIAATNQHFRMWDVAERTEVKFSGGLINELATTTTALAAAPDGKTILTGTTDNEILVWEVSPETGRRIFKLFLRGHKAPVTSLAFSPDGRFVLSGSEDQTLRLWRLADFQNVRILSGHTDIVNSAIISPDLQLIYSASDDCSMRIWDLAAGREIVSVYQSKDGEWIHTTPDGYYASSPEGNKLLYWVYANSTESFSFEQYESVFKRPDIIKARLAGQQSAGKPLPMLPHPPRIDTDDHMTYRETHENRYRLQLLATSPQNVKVVRIFVNGRPVLEIPVESSHKELSLDIPLFSGANRITALAYDGNGFSSNPKYVDVNSRYARSEKQNLYILAVGVSTYDRLSQKWQLEWAHSDAQAVINEFERQKGRLFRDVQHSLLINGEANSKNIIKAIDALGNLSENDTAIIFMAGHGIRGDDGTFYFLTSNGRPGELPSGGLDWALIGDYLQNIKARVILFLDACHSGSIVTETVVPNDELAHRLFKEKRSGIMIFSASKGRQYSMETADIGGGTGIFTHGLLLGIGTRSKDADMNRNGIVEFMELVGFVTAYVDDLSEGEQTPWLSRKEMFGDFPIAAAD